MTDGISIGVGMNEAGDGVAGSVGTITAFAKTPAEFVAVVLIDDAALILFPTAAFVDVPVADVLEIVAVLRRSRTSLPPILPKPM